MSPRPRSVSDPEIFAATARVLSRTGPAGLTVAAVAAEAGLAPSSLVQRFGTRRNLLLAFAQQAPGAVRDVFAAAERRAGSPIAALGDALASMVADVGDARELANHVAFLQMDLSDPDFRRHAVAHGLAFRDAARRLILAATAAGELPPGNAAERARQLHLAYNGALITWALHEEGTLEGAVRGAVALVLGSAAAVVRRRRRER